jgi:integrase/recombinase XerD
MRSWIGAPTTRHNQHQRVIAFFSFCIEQGWLKENAAKSIKKVPRQQDETLFFTREQYDALIEATYYYDRRGEGNGGQTTNSLRVRAYLKLLRWSGEADQGAEGGRARAISSNPPATSAQPVKIS